MKATRLLMLTAVFVIASSTMALADTSVPGSRQIQFANFDSQCINVAKNTVDFWITSAKINKDQSWLTDTNGVGVNLSVVLDGPQGKRSFPSADSISTVDLPGSTLVRAPLRLPVLSQYALYGSGFQLTSMSAPLTFSRTKGDSDIAKYTKAMIDFSKNATTLLPSNPYAAGAEEVGQLASKVLGALTPDAASVVDPNFQLNYTLSHADQHCNPQDLHDNVQAWITDPKNNHTPNTIKTSEAGNFCFYADPQASDPSVYYASKPSGGSCLHDKPVQALELNNPQIIIAVWGVPNSPEAAASVAARPNSDEFHTLARLISSDVTTAAIKQRAAAARIDLGINDLAEVKTALDQKDSGLIKPSNKASALARAASICASANMSPDKCFKPSK